MNRFKLDYYYNNNCKCCEGYSTVLFDVEQAFKIPIIYHNTEEEHNLPNITGVPTVILSDGNGIEWARWMGKYTYPNLSDKITEAIGNYNVE